MPVVPRYEIRKGEGGWTVIDGETGGPVEIDGFVQIGLPLEDADDLADALNALDREQRGAAAH